MSIAIQIPSVLRHECGGLRQLTLSGSTVREALGQLECEHPSLYRSVCDETGAVRRHVHLFVNDSFLSGPDSLETKLAPGDELAIMPAVSGG